MFTKKNEKGKQLLPNNDEQSSCVELLASDTRNHLPTRDEILKSISSDGTELTKYNENMIKKAFNQKKKYTFFLTSKYISIEDIKIYPLHKNVIMNDKLLLHIFCTDYKKLGNIDAMGPFLPFDFECKQKIKPFYERRINLLYKKDKDEINIKCLFSFECDIGLSVSLSVMILHHAGIINLFNRENGGNFKEFLQFTGMYADNSLQKSKHGSSELDFLSKSNHGSSKLDFVSFYDIENQGLSCIIDMSDIDIQTYLIFQDYMNALCILYNSNSSERNVDLEKYNQAYNKFFSTYKKYKYTDEETDQSSFLSALVDAVYCVHRCITVNIAKNVPSTNDKLHYCTCDDPQKKNTIINTGSVALFEKPNTHVTNTDTLNALSQASSNQCSSMNESL